MSKMEALNAILRKLQTDGSGVEASALIAEDGLLIASALTPEGMAPAGLASSISTRNVRVASSARAPT